MKQLGRKARELLRLSNLSRSNKIERLKLKLETLKAKLADADTLMRSLPVAEVMIPDPLVRATEPILCRICAPHDTR
jgi:hypothetical protein